MKNPHQEAALQLLAIIVESHDDPESDPIGAQIRMFALGVELTKHSREDAAKIATELSAYSTLHPYFGSGAYNGHIIGKAARALLDLVEVLA